MFIFNSFFFKIFIFKHCLRLWRASKHAGWKSKEHFSDLQLENYLIYETKILKQWFCTVMWKSVCIFPDFLFFWACSSYYMHYTSPRCSSFQIYFSILACDYICKSRVLIYSHGTGEGPDKERVKRPLWVNNLGNSSGEVCAWWSGLDPLGLAGSSPKQG